MTMESAMNDKDECKVVPILNTLYGMMAPLLCLEHPLPGCSSKTTPDQNRHHTYEDSEHTYIPAVSRQGP